MLVYFNENYITVFATNFSYCYDVLLTELQDKEHAKRTGTQDRNQGRPLAMKAHFRRMG